MTAPATFPRLARLRHAREFRRVRDARLRKGRGPLLVSGVPNGLGRCRLGLSIGRRFGGAVDRNGCKRLVREAFRLARSELDALSPSLDLVVAVRPPTRPPTRPATRSHTRPHPGEYRALLIEAAAAIRREIGRRTRRSAAQESHSGAGP
ncbi:MAG: ribonuclease P protein component [Planctomycetota bacterium]